MSQYQADNLTAEVVAEYLRDHPDFFQQRQGIMDLLSLPTQQQGTVSLVEVQLKRQREKISQLEEEITQLMEIASHNDQNFHQFMQLQEAVLRSTSIEQVIGHIDQQARTLSLKAYVQLFDAPTGRHQLCRKEWKRFAINHFNGKDAYLGRLKKMDSEGLFGQQTTPEMGSFVVLPLETVEPLGIIAFSSTDGSHFQPNMDTLFLRHLALVVSHLVTTLSWDREDKTYAISSHAAH